MVLQEIEKQVRRWLEEKNGELAGQQRSLEAAYQNKVRAIQEDYEKKLNAVRAEYQAQQERFITTNKQHMEEARQIQRQVQNASREIETTVSKGKQELNGITSRQSAMQAACERSLEEQEQAFKKQEKVLKRMEEDMEQMNDSKGSGGRLPLILSAAALGLVLIMLVLLQTKVFPFGGSAKATPTPTPIVTTPTPEPTAEPTPEPTATPEPTPTPTPDPMALAKEAFPFLDSAALVTDEERIDLDGAECLAAYRFGSNSVVFVNVFQGDAVDETAFRKLCEANNTLVIEPALGPMETEPVKEDDRTTTVLAGVQKGKYLCTFFARQKEARDVDYWAALQDMEQYLGISPDEIVTYLSAFPEENELIDLCRYTKAIYPIQESLVSDEWAEAYGRFVEENQYRAIWLYSAAYERPFLCIYDETFDQRTFEGKVKGIRNIVNPSILLIGSKGNNEKNLALVFPNTNAKDMWYEAESWFTGIGAEYKLKQVR